MHIHSIANDIVAATNSHSILAKLEGAAASNDEYVELSGLLRHLLHPEACQRATVEQALASPFFKLAEQDLDAEMVAAEDMAKNNS